MYNNPKPCRFGPNCKNIINTGKCSYLHPQLEGNPGNQPGNYGPKNPQQNKPWNGGNSGVDNQNNKDRKSTR